MLRSISLCTVLLICAGFANGQGSWVDTTFVPPSLGFENPIMIYLPEGYDPGGTLDYQVTIWLHGWGNHYFDHAQMIGEVHDSLVATGDMDPCIFASPEGWCMPYYGSMWANSELYGNYEGYVAEDVIAFLDTNYCTLGDEARYIMGSSMGGSGALDLAIRHPDLFQCVCTSGAMPDMVVSTPMTIAQVISECPETEPPYTYDWGNGFYTNGQFLYAGGYSPNLSAPDSVDFLLDEYGNVIDSVYALWELHNAAHTVKLNPPSDLLFGITWGSNDGIVGLIESNNGFVDTLEALALPHVVSVDEGGHSVSRARCAQMLLIAMGETGIGDGPILPPSTVLRSPFPNPFSFSTTIAFELSEAGNVQLTVYDLSGRLVRILLDEPLAAGDHYVNLSSHDLESGIYLIRLDTGSESRATRAVVLR